MAVVNLGSYLSVLEGWKVCIDECNEECIACLDFSSLGTLLTDEEKVLLAIYLVAKKTRRYQLVAAMHIYSVKHKVIVRPETIRSAELKSDDIIKELRITCYDIPWETVFWRGLCYAQTFLDLEKPVIVKVTPPKDKREREKLRVLIEGKRITIKGKTYNVGGLLKKIGGRKIAPWVYLIPKKSLQILQRELNLKTYDILM